MTTQDATPPDLRPPPPPVLRVVSGNPSDDELAALVTVVASAVSGPKSNRASEAIAAPRSEWRDRGRLLRRPHAFGPGAWRASSWAR